MNFFSRKKDKSPSWNIIDPPTAYARPPTAHPASPPQYNPIPHQSQHYAPPSSYPHNPYHGNTIPSQNSLDQHAPPPPPRQQPPARPRTPKKWSSAYVIDLADSAVSSVYDDVSARLDDVMTRIDREAVSATEAGLFFCRGGGTPGVEDEYTSASEGEALDRSLAHERKPRKKKTRARKQKDGSRFAKVELYANSKLPLSLPPLRLYMPTWPLLCLAAQYSSQVYASSSSASSSNPPPPATNVETSSYTSSDWRAGTRATLLTCVPMDHASAIVFAIRGTSSFMDWAVNLNTAPTSPENFLDDPGNLCHAGFLAVARNMVKPVAARLRRLLEEDSRRASYSLLLTGHSAGGSIAALLYMHMLATADGTESELNNLAGCFKRIHCVTFGAPPVSLLPLEKPKHNPRRLAKSLFLAFVNEGDPVARADKAYVRSLLELLTRPAPELEELACEPQRPQDRKKVRWGDKGEKPALPRRRYKQVHWPVPPCELSNAGRIVVLRTGDPMAVMAGTEEKTVEERLAEGTVAVTCEESDLRGVVWGDPVCHMMGLYAGRIEALAVAAVMGQR